MCWKYGVLGLGCSRKHPQVFLKALLEGDIQQRSSFQGHYSRLVNLRAKKWQDEAERLDYVTSVPILGLIYRSLSTIDRALRSHKC